MSKITTGGLTIRQIFIPKQRKTNLFTKPIKQNQRRPGKPVPSTMADQGLLVEFSMTCKTWDVRVFYNFKNEKGAIKG